MPPGGNGGRTTKCRVAAPLPQAPPSGMGPWLWGRVRAEGNRDKEVGGHRGALCLGEGWAGKRSGARGASRLTDLSPLTGATAKTKARGLSGLPVERQVGQSQVGL